MSSLTFQSPGVAPSGVERLLVPDEPDVAFRGFGREAFELLERLRIHPHIEQYRKEKDGITAHLKDPFKTYRDDLVVNLVLPGRLELETERNVFSRLLKNDFGAGGCHHHFWLSFYRPHRTRLTDIQLAHSLRPSGLRIAVFAGRQANDIFHRARQRILRAPERFAELVRPLLDAGNYTLAYRRGGRIQRMEVLDLLPSDIDAADAFTVYRTLPADDVVRLGRNVMPIVLRCLTDLWSTYRFLLS